MKRCSCNWCERTEENCKDRFKRIDNRWYCSKHYQQLKRHGKLKDTKGTICGIGINDMPKGWTIENKREYTLWSNMLTRCYSEECHKLYPSYDNCYVCERWLRLSNFIEDLPKIKNYDYWLKNPNKKISLDKDIKSNNNNKCYCLEECQFVDMETNTIQAWKNKKHTDETKEKMKTNHADVRGKNNPSSKRIVQLDFNNNFIKEFDYIKQASQKTGINRCSIGECCRGVQKTGGKDEHEKPFKWMYKEYYDLFTKLNEYYEFDNKGDNKYE